MNFMMVLTTAKNYMENVVADKMNWRLSIFINVDSYACACKNLFTTLILHTYKLFLNERNSLYSDSLLLLG